MEWWLLGAPSEAEPLTSGTRGHVGLDGQTLPSVDSAKESTWDQEIDHYQPLHSSLPSHQAQPTMSHYSVLVGPWLADLSQSV